MAKEASMATETPIIRLLLLWSRDLLRLDIFILSSCPRLRLTVMVPYIIINKHTGIKKKVLNVATIYLLLVSTSHSLKQPPLKAKMARYGVWTEMATTHDIKIQMKRTFLEMSFICKGKTTAINLSTEINRRPMIDTRIEVSARKKQSLQRTSESDEGSWLRKVPFDRVSAILNGMIVKGVKRSEMAMLTTK